MDCFFNIVSALFRIMFIKLRGNVIVLDYLQGLSEKNEGAGSGNGDQRYKWVRSQCKINHYITIMMMFVYIIPHRFSIQTFAVLCWRKCTFPLVLVFSGNVNSIPQLVGRIWFRPAQKAHSEMHILFDGKFPKCIIKIWLYL